jgi:starch-binding outer membrane protein, SusD/RagB family
MKKKIYYLFVIAFILASCEKIMDVNPTDAVSADMAIGNKTGVEHALVGSYNALQATGLYGLNGVVVGDLTADNLTWAGTTQSYGQFEIKPIPSANGVVDGMWAACYDGINRVNNILYRLPSISDLTQAENDQYTGEALFIRALLHFNLATYFGGVPLRTQPTLDLSNIDLQRSPVEQVYEQVIADLNEAKSKLSEEKVTGRANTFCASALLAKVYLAKFQLTNDKASAVLSVSEATRVISDGGYALVSNYVDLFHSPDASSESVFEVVYDVQNYNRLAQYFYSRDSLGRYEFAPTSDLIQSFDTIDQRLEASITYDGKNKPYVIKYNDVSGGTDRVYVFRLAEMYLIRAEALAYTDGDIVSILSDINTIRNRAGLGNTTADNYSDLKLAIENECRHEFAFEGHRWADLVRTKRAVPLLGIDEKYTLFPIPLSEMQTNKLIKQNLGY